MSIFGIGTDIVSIDRMKKSLKNKKFIKRVFNIQEILKCKKIKDFNNCFAKRFAAKEAFSKALGTGFRSGLEFKDIEIVNDRAGKPQYVKNKKIKKIVQNKFKIKNFNSFLSITDEKDYSTAFTIIQSS